MATPNVKTQSGNRMVVELDGQAVGLLQTFRADDDYGLEPATGIGDIHVQEHVPTRATHRISVSSMTLIKGNLRDLGIAVENGDAALQGLVFDACEYSKDSGALLRKYRGCSYASGSVEVSANRIVMTNGQIFALDASGTGI